MTWIFPAETARDAIEAKLKVNGEFPNGRFAVRHRPEADAWVLSVNYRGKPTHHKCTKSGGTVVVNGKSYGDASNIDELVDTLGSKVPGWPVPLTDKVSNSGGSGGSSKSSGGGSSKSSGGGSTGLVHGPMSKAAADSLANEHLGDTDGNYFIRKRGKENPDDFVLTVIYKGKPTQHLIAQDESGGLKINNKPSGESAVKELLLKLRTKQPFWPVPLKEHLTTQKKMANLASGGSSGGVSSPKKAVTRNKSTTDTKSGGQDWLHPAMSKADADALMEEDGEMVDGKFFIRRRDKKGEYVMCVVFRGKATHHLIQTQDGELIINKKSAGGSKTLTELVEFLRNKSPTWPVPLKGHISSGSSVDSTAKKASSSLSNESGSYEWLHPPMAKGDADALMNDSGDMNDGKFFIRRRDNEGEFVMCVVFRGKPTHHLITTQNGKLMINKRPAGEATNLSELVKFLRDKSPSWPVPLKEHVSINGGTATESEKADVQEPEQEQESEPEPEPKSISDPKPAPVKAESAEKSTKTTASSVKEDKVEEPELTESELRAKELLEDPNKLWVQGQKLDVTFSRKSLAMDFGFSVAEKFRLAGRAKVIASVRQGSPAAEFLKVGDEILTLSGEPVFHWELNEVKRALRSLALTFEARVFRPSTLAAKKAPEISPKERSYSTVEYKKYGFLTRSKEVPLATEVPPEEAEKIQTIVRNGIKVKCAHSIYCPGRANSRNAKKQQQIEARVLEKVRNRLAKKQAKANPANLTSVNTTYNKTFDVSEA